jgi:hypothetical protein
MTKTEQFCSLVSINEAVKELNKHKAEDKLFILFSASDNMSVINERLAKLKDILKDFSIELNIFHDNLS